MRLHCSVNGVAAHELPITDRGFQYGDGIFETIFCLSGVPLRLDAHWARLTLGCERLGIAVPDARGALLQAVRAQGDRRVVAKLVVTRGCSERGYRIPDDIGPNWVLTVSEAPDLPREARERGVAVRMCRTRLAHEDEQLVGLKHLNRLTQVMARREWGAEYYEGLLLDMDGHLSEGCASNVFIVTGGRLATPALARGGVHGVMRRSVMVAARTLGVPANERLVRPEELFAADEVFLTNVVQGVVPVRTVEARHYAVGPFTKRLVAHFDATPDTDPPRDLLRIPP
jgi:4-amino-4-deoxychorismate lyase